MLHYSKFSDWTQSTNSESWFFMWSTESTEYDEWKWKWPQSWSATTPTLKSSFVFAFAVSYGVCRLPLLLSLLVSGSLSFLTDLLILRLWLLVLFQHRCITLCHPLPISLSVSLIDTHTQTHTHSRILTRLSRLSSLHHRWGWWAAQLDTTDPAIFKFYACLISAREIIAPICALRSLSPFLYLIFSLLFSLIWAQVSLSTRVSCLSI